MLIILTGAEGIGRRQIARSILAELNTFEWNGFDLKFDYDSAGNRIVTFTKGDYTAPFSEFTDVVSDEDLPDDFLDIVTVDGTKEADRIWEEIFLSKVTVWHTYDAHLDLDYDLGATTELEVTDMLHDVDVVNMYNTKPAEIQNLVVSGSFSKYYLDHLREQLGESNVVVYNIIRNPSVSFLLDQKDDEFYISDTKPDLTREVNDIKFIESTLGSVILKDVDYVNTIRFEDIMQSQSITINGTTVGLASSYSAYNNYITNYEKNNHIETDLTDINSKLTNFNILDWHNESDFSSAEHLSTMQGNLPSNLFTALGYTAQSYASITT